MAAQAAIRKIERLPMLISHNYNLPHDETNREQHTHQLVLSDYTHPGMVPSVHEVSIERCCECGLVYSSIVFSHTSVNSTGADLITAGARLASTMTSLLNA